LALAVWQADWVAFKRVPQRQHLLFASLAALLVLWTLSIEVAPGMHIHLLGVTALTLMVGWPIAIIGASLVLVIELVIGPEPLMALPLSWLLTVGLPATITRLLVIALRRLGQPNPYLFLFGAGFGGGVLSVVLVAGTWTTLLTLLGQADWQQMLQDHWPVLALAAFPEGFVNGMVITAITVVNPGWVKTFDETYYQHTNE
jgi:uncharacterized membrane protein